MMESKIFIESIRISYTNNDIPKEVVIELVLNGTIDIASYKYITGETFNEV